MGDFVVSGKKFLLLIVVDCRRLSFIASGVSD